MPQQVLAVTINQVLGQMVLVVVQEFQQAEVVQQLQVHPLAQATQ